MVDTYNPDDAIIQIGKVIRNYMENPFKKYTEDDYRSSLGKILYYINLTNTSKQPLKSIHDILMEHTVGVFKKYDENHYKKTLDDIRLILLNTGRLYG